MEKIVVSIYDDDASLTWWYCMRRLRVANVLDCKWEKENYLESRLRIASRLECEKETEDHLEHRPRIASVPEPKQEKKRLSEKWTTCCEHCISKRIQM